MQEKIEESWSFFKATFTPNFSIIAVTKLKATLTPNFSIIAVTKLKATFTTNFSIIAVTKLGCEIVQSRET